MKFDGNQYEIIRTTSSKSKCVNLINEEGQRVQEPDEILNLISKNIDIYLQKQIFEMSKNQTNIRDFLDSYCLSDIEPIRSKIIEKESIIKKLSLDNFAKEAELSKSEGLVLEISDLKNKLKRLSNPRRNSRIKRKFE